MTVAQLLEWLDAAPAGTLLDAGAVRLQLGQLDERESATPIQFASWRERLWIVPEQTRIGTREACEALGRSDKWLRERLKNGGDGRIPHRKLEGELVFLVGELRAWIQQHEQVLVRAEGVLPLHARKRA